MRSSVRPRAETTSAISTWVSGRSGSRALLLEGDRLGLGQPDPDLQAALALGLLQEHHGVPVLSDPPSRRLLGRVVDGQHADHPHLAHGPRLPCLRATCPLTSFRPARIPLRRCRAPMPSPVRIDSHPGSRRPCRQALSSSGCLPVAPLAPAVSRPPRSPGSLPVRSARPPSGSLRRPTDPGTEIGSGTMPSVARIVELAGARDDAADPAPRRLP